MQGVGFRWWTQRKGAELGLRGDVRNLPDGSVEVQVAGTAEALVAFAEALEQGPSLSRVDAVVPAELRGAIPDAGFLLEGR